jgi:hypothetical protein
MPIKIGDDDVYPHLTDVTSHAVYVIVDACKGTSSNPCIDSSLAHRVVLKILQNR